MTYRTAYLSERLKDQVTEDAFQGALDPARATGYLTAHGGHLDVRIINGEYYLCRGGTTWVKTGRSMTSVIPLGPTQEVVAELNADPSVLLTKFRTLGNVTQSGRSGSGADAVDTYTFSYPVTADESRAAHTIAGTVTVGVDSGMIRSVVQDTTLTGANPEIADREPVSFRTTVELSDYNTPVTVEQPQVSGG